MPNAENKCKREFSSLKLYSMKNVANKAFSLEDSKFFCYKNVKSFLVFIKQRNYFLLNLVCSLEQSTDICKIKVNPMSKVCNNSSFFMVSTVEITEIKNQTLDFNAEFNTSTDDLKLIKVLKPVEPIRLDNLTHIQVMSIMSHFKMLYFSRYLNWCLELVRVLISFSFFIMFVNSFKYYKAYLTDISFDNACITQRFRDIDARRLGEKRTLLPLKNFETYELHYPLDIHVSAYQKPNFLIKMYAKVGLMGLSLLLLLFDLILTDFLLIFKVSRL